MQCDAAAVGAGLGKQVCRSLGAVRRLRTKVLSGVTPGYGTGPCIGGDDGRLPLPSPLFVAMAFVADWGALECPPGLSVDGVHARLPKW